MSAIPADILASAENALDLMLCNCREAGDVRQDSIRDIALAILAERDRACAVALDEKVGDTGFPEDISYNLAIDHVIEAIRAPLPTQPEGQTP